MLVGAGIGVTPFASIIKCLYDLKKNDAKCKIEKAYFFWICRDMTSFEWFQSLLRGIFISLSIFIDLLIVYILFYKI